MKRWLAGLIRHLARVSGIPDELRAIRAQTEASCPHFSKETQVLLLHTYRQLAHSASPSLPKLSEVGFRCFSQFEEDGILLYLFALLGTTNRAVVEICAGNGIECNSANLIVNHGWWGYLFDGDERNVAEGLTYYRKSRDTWLYPPRFVNAWITAENVNELIRSSGIKGEVDLLSLDIDGMDYWIWQAIECITPRVVVCEAHNIVAAEDALVMRYDPNFRITVPDYCGASLAAMTKLAAQKGYRLVGTHRYGFNAFFVRNDLGRGLLEETSPEECLRDPYTAEAQATRWPKVRDLDWVRV